MTLQIREYQSRAVDALSNEFRRGKRAPILVAPTGSGKTVMLSQCVARHLQRPEKYVNWYAHRGELVEQAARTLHEKFGLPVGYGGLSISAPIQVLTVQAALSRGRVRDGTLNVFDEAHHFASAAEDWFRIRQAHAKAFIVGATATPERGDGQALDGFDGIVVAAQISELQAMWKEDPSLGLVPVETLRPAKPLGKNRIARSPVDVYKKVGAGRRNVVFSPNVPAAVAFCEEFNAAGIPAAVITGKLRAGGHVDQALADFAAGKLRVLCNVHILTEGWDCPSVGMITIAREIHSDGLWMQMCGRGMRPSPGKTVCTVADLFGSWHYRGDPDEDREFSLTGLGIRRTADAGGRRRFCKTCGTEIAQGETKCSGCDRATGRQLGLPKIADVDLERAARLEKFQREPMAVRILTLGRWVREADAKGYGRHAFFGTNYSVVRRYQAKYGERPTKQMIEAARQVRQ